MIGDIFGGGGGGGVLSLLTGGGGLQSLQGNPSYGQSLPFIGTALGGGQGNRANAGLFGLGQGGPGDQGMGIQHPYAYGPPNSYITGPGLQGSETVGQYAPQPQHQPQPQSQPQPQQQNGGFGSGLGSPLDMFGGLGGIMGGLPGGGMPGGDIDGLARMVDDRGLGFRKTSKAMKDGNFGAAAKNFLTPFHGGLF